MAASSAVSSVESLCNRLLRSRLLKPPQVKKVYAEWRKIQSPGIAGEVDRFVRWLVSKRHVTGYQAQQIVLGHTDHFFLTSHYKLLDLVGRGRMAGIFKAVHIMGHIVAIKVIPPSKAQDAKVLARFKREGRMAVRLQHPNIVRTYHMGMAHHRHFIVMEYLEGETLEDVLKRRKKLPSGEAVRLIHQALWGLQQISDEGLVHRDLKPGNLMVTPVRPPGAPDNTLHATLKILDIGLGRVLFEESMWADNDAMKLTVEGSMIGTLDYMAPEQLRDAHKADIRSDIYSLGCVLYQMLSGQTPFADKNQIQQMIRIAQEAPRPVRQLEPSVPDGLQNVLGIMLNKDPKQRFTEPAHAAQALQGFVHQAKDVLPEVKPLGQSYEKWVQAHPEGATPTSGVVADRWFYSHDNKRQGPVTSAQLDQLAATGQLAPDDLLWMEGDDPAYGVHARAAVDFDNLRGRPMTPAEMGFDPSTGRILDQAKFRQWQKWHQKERNLEMAKAPTIQDAYLKARTELSGWLDQQKNRPLILTGDMEAIRQDPTLQQFMKDLGRYGEEIIHKMWHHLEFMVENRRKYFYALNR
jgi:eukaryotic-like serine/threonine-protein kinase